MKGSIQQEEMAIINIYPPNNRPSKSMKQKLTVEGRNIGSSTIAVGDVNIPLSITERPDGRSKQHNKPTKTNKHTGHSTQQQLLGAHGTFSRADHMLGYKLSLNRLKKISYKVPSLTTVG